ncbi:uncharacterized protein LOC124633958 [Helicoverpa zea]|uniref:uncharacterized protein LOC124633958 n=1 Tax=Helicoverpa zea TaxID=7113 RepID=UPI001F5AC502|nr:uncharacterized protein LOC124633958 [Helicoverpa zea]
MSVVPSNLSFNSSVTTSQYDSQDDAEPTKVKNYLKERLKSRIFLGRYVERRLADKRIGYRDIVVVSPAEVKLKKDLLDVQHKLITVCPSTHWIGITDTETLGYTSGVCLWTEIDNQPFGPFWFQIKSLKFRDDEVMVQLKCLRHISDAFLEIEPILTGAVKTTKSTETTEKKLESSVASLNETYTDFVATLKSFLSISNVKEFITFLLAFVIAIFTGSSSFINFLGNFILALVRELSLLVKNSTPMFLGLLDFFSKIVGGFYILLAMFFRQSAPPPPNKRTIGAYDRSRRSYNHYDDGQFD